MVQPKRPLNITEPIGIELKDFKPFIIMAILGVALAISTACGHDNSSANSNNNAIKIMASVANKLFIDDIMTGSKKNNPLNLKYVLDNKDKYGLSDIEETNIKNSLQDEDLSKLILEYIDPRKPEQRGNVEAIPRWAFITSMSDDDHGLENIEVTTPDGQIDTINGIAHPDNINYPIITLAYCEKMKGVVPAIQGFNIIAEDEKAKKSGFMKLETLKFEDINEPWIKGRAEVYAVVSFIDKDGTGKTELYDFPTVDYAKTEYRLDQLIHSFEKNRYRPINIAFFEKDSNMHYAELLQLFTDSASSINVIASSDRMILVNANSKLAKKIIQALPQKLARDDDDFIDSINTIENHKDSDFRHGVGGNVTAKFSF